MKISVAVMDSLAVSWRRAERSLAGANVAGGPATRLLAEVALDGYFALVDFVLDDVNKRLDKRQQIMRSGDADR